MAVACAAIARRLHRAPSTISREVRRNAATSGGYLDCRALTAQWHADRRARRPKRAKLAVNDALREYMQDRLAGAGTPIRSDSLPGQRIALNGTYTSRKKRVAAAYGFHPPGRFSKCVEHVRAAYRRNRFGEANIGLGSAGYEIECSARFAPAFPHR